MQNQATDAMQDDAAGLLGGASPEEIIYRIDIPANRYDMLCLEGIARALNIFRRRQGPIHYRLADMSGERLRQPAYTDLYDGALL